MQFSPPCVLHLHPWSALSNCIRYYRVARFKIITSLCYFLPLGTKHPPRCPVSERNNPSKLTLAIPRYITYATLEEPLQLLPPHTVGGGHETVDIQSFITTLPCQLLSGSFLCNTNWLESHPLTTSWDQSWFHTYRQLNRLADVSCKRHPLIVQTAGLYLAASFTCVLFSNHSSNSDQSQDCRWGFGTWYFTRISS
jgi:hypothetical protein